MLKTFLRSGFTLKGKKITTSFKSGYDAIFTNMTIWKQKIYYRFYRPEILLCLLPDVKYPQVIYLLSEQCYGL